MTLSGVRNSCDASAVNSSWRRRASSIGIAARRPMIVAARNKLTRMIGASTASTRRSVERTLATSSVLVATTIRPLGTAVPSRRNVRPPIPESTGRPARRSDAGRAGALVLSRRAWVAPTGTNQARIGASSKSSFGVGVAAGAGLPLDCFGIPWVSETRRPVRRASIEL